MPFNRFKDRKLNEIFEYISNTNKKAYKDIYLLSNQVLSKNTLTNSFFDNYIENKILEPIKIHQIFLKIIIYYVKSIIHYLRFLFQKLAYLLSNQKFSLESLDDEIIIIDVFFLMNKSFKSNEYFYNYFSGFNKILDKRGITYAYLPRFFTNKSIIKLYKVLRQIKNSRIPVLTEYQLLSLKHLFKLLTFIVLYPIHVLKLVYSLNNNSIKNRYLKFELLRSLDRVTFRSFSQYLVGRRVSSIHCKTIKIVSKYENQVDDKNYYKGLRSGGNKVFIYGCQLFIYPFSLLNINADPNEVQYGVIPDKILVNGNYYLYENSKIKSVVGPSFRYKYIFNNDLNNYNNNNLLVLLPQNDYGCDNILKILHDIDYKYGEVIIKCHPTSRINDYENLIPKNARISNKNLSELFQNVKIILSNESGSLVEGVSMAIPSIVVNNRGKYTHNPLSDYGKGIIWDYAECADEVNTLIDKFQDSLKDNKRSLVKISEKYKEMFFCKPTEEKIVEVFDL